MSAPICMDRSPSLRHLSDLHADWRGSPSSADMASAPAARSRPDRAPRPSGAPGCCCSRMRRCPGVRQEEGAGKPRSSRSRSSCWSSALVEEAAERALGDAQRAGRRRRRACLQQPPTWSPARRRRRTSRSRPRPAFSAMSGWANMAVRAGQRRRTKCAGAPASDGDAGRSCSKPRRARRTPGTR